MNTNTELHATTTTTSGSKGSDSGNKIRGAVEVVHGAGENIRGTVLGAVDTMGHRGPTENDAIAQQGRLEMERGLAHLRGSKPRAQDHAFGTGSTHTHTDPISHQSTTTGAVGGSPDNYPQAQRNTSASFGAGPGPTNFNTKGNALTENNNVNKLGSSEHNPNLGSTGGTTYPSHHREDAIANVPSPQLHEIQAMSTDPTQTQHMRSEYDPSRAEYRKQAQQPAYGTDVPSNEVKSGNFGVGGMGTATNGPVN